jgi:DNA-binding transcriptional LysR family regulator
MKRHFDDLLLGSIELFCLAAEAGSFTAAALTAGVTPAAVSRSISRLEKRLGVRLFVRSTRSIRLTDGGRLYFDQCRQALSQLVDAERQVTGEQLQPAGILRISSPTTFGHHRLLPALPAFRARHPLIKVEAHISNRNVLFLEEDFDVAIRVRPPPDSNMIARLLEDATLVMVASPDYLKRAGIPKTLEDLAEHDCIQFVLPSSGRKIAWLFRDKGEDRELVSEGNYACSDDVLAGVTLARSGAGLFQAYRFVVEKDLAAGSLVEVLQDFAGRSRPYNLIYPHGRMLPLRVRAFVDYILECSREWQASNLVPVKKAALRR